MVQVIIIGQIDLSVGSVAGLCGGFMAMCGLWLGLSPVVSLILALVSGFLIGLWQGWWIAYRNVPSFIATLAGLLVFRGVLVGVSDGITVGPLDPFFRVIGKDFMPANIGIILGAVAAAVFVLFTWLDWSKKRKIGFDTKPPIFKSVFFAALIMGFVFLMNGYKGVPIPVVILLVLFVIYNYITTKTVFGRRIYAIGGNKKASVLAGINTKRITLAVFTINGVMAALAGVFLAARLDSASIQAGQSAELDAIAACVIGGTSLAGGVGTVFGAVVGAIVISSIDNGMSLLNAQAFYQTIVKGLVLLLAVWFDMSQRKEGA